MRIKWLEKALSDLAETTEYIAQDDLDAAKRMAACIRERIETLPQRPHIGRPGRVTGTRELVLDNYPFVIPYRVKSNEIQILRVFHTSQRLPKRW